MRFQPTPLARSRAILFLFQDLLRTAELFALCPGIVQARLYPLDDQLLIVVAIILIKKPRRERNQLLWRVYGRQCLL
jgi:hypothetical protein